MREPFEITSTGVVIRGDLKIRGDLIVLEARVVESPAEAIAAVFAEATREGAFEGFEQSVRSILSKSPEALDRSSPLPKRHRLPALSRQPLRVPEDFFARALLASGLAFVVLRSLRGRSSAAQHRSPSSVPVVVSNAPTVADAGEAASFPGQGPE